jgi:hypothetical protein
MPSRGLSYIALFPEDGGPCGAVSLAQDRQVALPPPLKSLLLATANAGRIVIAIPAASREAGLFNTFLCLAV